MTIDEQSHRACVSYAEVEQVADRAATKAVERTLERVGIDPNDTESARRVWHWARKSEANQTKMVDNLRSGAARAVAGTFIGGVALILWFVIEAFVRAKGGK